MSTKISKYKILTSLTDHELCEIMKDATSISDVLRKTGCNQKDSRCRKYIIATAKRLNFYDGLKSTLYHSLSKDIVAEAVNKSYCVSDVITNIGLKNHGANYKTVAKLIVQYGICTKHFNAELVRARGKRIYKQEEIFCVNSPYPRSALSRAARKYSILPYKCVSCGNAGTWMNQALPLVLDHVNGINNDNRVDNLRYLCYNCHALTDTFAGRNKK